MGTWDEGRSSYVQMYSSATGAYAGASSTATGNYTVAPWEIAVTNRFEGKTEQFWCQYQAVREGRILHLTNKAASGIQYHLVRTK